MSSSLFWTTACRNQPAKTESTAQLELPTHFPPWPETSPSPTEAQLELGRWLFYDRRLSRDGTRSCGICHEQAKAFSDGLSRAIGIDNTLLPLNSPALFNILWREELTWHSGFEAVESQMLVPLFSEEPVEMGMTEALMLQRLAEAPYYGSLFEAAYPNEANPIHTDNAIEAIAHFTRSIFSYRSRYDRWLEGELELTVDEAAGQTLFYSERFGCAQCHGGVFFDDPSIQHLEQGRHGYFNTGLYNLDGEGAYPEDAQGLIATSGLTSDMGKFRVPTLRNLDATYPWMHDGSEISLSNIIQNYARGGRRIESGANAGDGQDNPYKSELITGFELDERELIQLLAFLNSLNDEALLDDPRLQSPFCIEQGGVIVNSPCEPPFEMTVPD